MRYTKLFLVLLIVCLLASCSESPKRIHEKLQTLLQSDLHFMVAETEKASGKKFLMDKPYYVVKDLRFFQGDTARMYGAYAEVDFYYYKDIAIFQKRKYRYDARYFFWDRYYKQLQFTKGPAPEPDTSKIHPWYQQDSLKTAKFPK